MVSSKNCNRGRLIRFEQLRGRLIRLEHEKEAPPSSPFLRESEHARRKWSEAPPVCGESLGLRRAEGSRLVDKTPGSARRARETHVLRERALVHDKDLPTARTRVLDESLGVDKCSLRARLLRTAPNTTSCLDDEVLDSLVTRITKSGRIRLYGAARFSETRALDDRDGVIRITRRIHRPGPARTRRSAIRRKENLVDDASCAEHLQNGQVRLIRAKGAREGGRAAARHGCIEDYVCVSRRESPTGGA